MCQKGWNGVEGVDTEDRYGVTGRCVRASPCGQLGIEAVRA
jgi:hypothetical protein